MSMAELVAIAGGALAGAGIWYAVRGLYALRGARLVTCPETGATVAVGDVIAMAETSKAMVEVPSPVAGTFVEKLVQNGSDVEVGAEIAVIET